MRNTSLYYSILQVLLKNLTEFYGKFIIVRHLGSMTFVVVNLTQAVVIKQMRARAVYMGISSMISLTMYTNFCIGPYEASLNLLSQLKKTDRAGSNNQAHTVEGRRIRKSFPVLKIPLGKICFYDRALVLTVVSIIMENVVNLVLALTS